MLRGKTYAEVSRNFKWEIPAYFNIGVDVCDKWAGDDSRIALIHVDSEDRERRYTFARLKTLSNRLANAMRAHGVGPGDRVGVLLSQRPETLISHVAAYKSGAVVVQLLTLFGPDALEYRLRDSGSRALVTDEENISKIDLIRDRLPRLETVIVINSGGREDVLDFQDCLDRGAPDFTPARTRPDDPALIIYTSGTTGQPKGTLHGHRLLLGIMPGFEFLHNLFPRKGDLLWTPLDWAYIGGSYDALFPALHHGCAVLACRPRKFDPEKSVHMMARYGVRNLMAVPTVLRMIMHAVERPRKRYDLRLRSVTVGGETLGDELAAWGREALGVEINEQYGQTECDLVVGFCSEIMKIVPGSIGAAIPGHDVGIIDEQGHPVPDGTMGEIAVRTPDPVAFLEYWGNPRATRDKYLGEWLRTGDYGAKDRHGFFRFSGRQDEIIESGGFRIGPGEIEDCLMNHEAVALAGVIGVPDPLRGEIVKAFIVPKEGVTVDKSLEENIKGFVKKRLEAHAYPRELTFLQEMPKTSTGKILKQELRRLHEEEVKVRY